LPARGVATREHPAIPRRGVPARSNRPADDLLALALAMHVRRPRARSGRSRSATARPGRC